MNIIKGRAHPPARRVIYGPPGVGKSTFACRSDPGSCPPETVLALDYEHGLDEIGPARVHGESTWAKSMELVRHVCQAKGDWDTVVIDTVDKLEEQAIEFICQRGVKGKSVSSLADFGYGDGYEALATEWRVLLFELERAREHGRSVHLVAHIQSKIQDDPMLGKYDKYIAALTKRSWGATHRWADAMLFAAYEQGKAGELVVMTGARVLHTVAGSGFEAKHRPNITACLPLSWSAYEEDCRKYMRTADEVRASIRTMARNGDSEKAEGYIKSAGDHIGRLIGIENALKKKVTEVNP